MKIKIQDCICYFVFLISPVFGTRCFEIFHDEVAEIQSVDNKTDTTVGCKNIGFKRRLHDVTKNSPEQNQLVNENGCKRRQPLAQIEDQNPFQEFCIPKPPEPKKSKSDGFIKFKCENKIVYEIPEEIFLLLFRQDRINLDKTKICKPESNSLNTDDSIIESLNFICKIIIVFLNDSNFTYFKNGQNKIYLSEILEDVEDELKNYKSSEFEMDENKYKEELATLIKSENLDALTLAIAKYFIFLYLNIKEINFSDEFVRLHSGILTNVFSEHYGHFEEGFETWVFSEIQTGKKCGFFINPYTRFVIALKRLKTCLKTHYDTVLVMDNTHWWRVPIY